MLRAAAITIVVLGLLGVCLYTAHGIAKNVADIVTLPPFNADLYK